MCLKQAHYQIPQRYCCKKKTPHLSIFVIYIKFYIPLCIVFKTNICDYTSSTKIKVNNYIDPLFNWYFLIIFNLIFFSKSDSQTRSIKIKRVQLNPVNTNSRYQDLIYIVNQLINFILQLSKKILAYKLKITCIWKTKYQRHLSTALLQETMRLSRKFIARE